MSCALDALWTQSVNALQAAGHRRRFRVVSTGKEFDGTLRIEAALDPDMPLGPDVRERTTLEVLAPGPDLEAEDQVQEGIEIGPGAYRWDVVWTVVRREKNPADVEVNYEVVQKIEADQE